MLTNIKQKIQTYNEDGYGDPFFNLMMAIITSLALIIFTVLWFSFPPPPSQNTLNQIVEHAAQVAVTTQSLQQLTIRADDAIQAGLATSGIKCSPYGGITTITINGPYGEALPQGATSVPKGWNLAVTFVCGNGYSTSTATQPVGAYVFSPSTP